MRILIRNKRLTAEAEGFMNVCTKCDEFLLYCIVRFLKNNFR